MVDRVRLAVAQNSVPKDPYDPRGLRTAGAEIRRLMGQAAGAGARLAASGIVAPGGAWLTRCAADDRPGIAVADLERGSADPETAVALRHARPWRRSARSGLYESRIPQGDPRSDVRTAF